MSFIGLTYGELGQFWRVFSETYYGGAEKAETMNDLLKPYAQLMYLTTAMSHPLLPAQMHGVYANMVRSQVLSRYDELFGCFAGI